MYSIYKKFEIASAHQLKGHPKCGKLHGHNYSVEVFMECERLDDKFGFILDFAAFKEIEKVYDHSDNVITESSEEFAETISHMVYTAFKKAQNDMTDVHIRVRVWESDHSYAEFARMYQGVLKSN